MKESAELLADYTKKATISSPVNNGDIADAIVTTFAPVVNPSQGTKPAVNPPLGTNLLGNPTLGTNTSIKRKRKHSTRAAEANNYLI